MNLKLRLLNFADEFSRDPDTALDNLEALLTDWQAVAERRRFVEELRRGRADDQHGFGYSIKEWETIVTTIGDLGPREAFAQGLLSVDQLDALSYHPAALERAHLRWWGGDPGEDLQSDQTENEPRTNGVTSKNRAEDASCEHDAASEW